MEEKVDVLEKIKEGQEQVMKLLEAFTELAEKLNLYKEMNKKVIQKDIIDNALYNRNLSILDQSMRALSEIAVNLQELYYNIYAFEELKIKENKPGGKGEQ